MAGNSRKSSRTKAKKKNSKHTRSSKNKRRSVKRSGTKSRTRNRTKTQTTSKSHTVTPEKSDERKRKEKGRANEFKEKEPDSEGRKTEERGGTESISKSKGNQVVQSSQIEQTKKIEVKNIEPDAEQVKRMLKKVKRDKPRMPQKPLDEKSKLLMDRVVKKPYPLKYMSKSNQELLMDEKSSFFKVSIPSPTITTNNKKGSEEDNYDGYPKLADVLKMPEDNVYVNDQDCPYWAVYMEPTDKDKEGVEEAISVGSDHLEAYNDHKLNLKVCLDKTIVILNPFQLTSELKKRDVQHFHDHLIFSNTMRSMINVQNTTSEASGGGQKNRKSERKEEKTPTVKATTKTIRIEARSPERFVYLRSDPIRTARDVRKKHAAATTTTTTQDC
ncbi:hypothetical protein L3Y34_002233 [Caenorhabditis briggsae]|uniref:Uncharacterized protein n=1 Tax=Caenorhabditis briggsae TaxID=6238 RepID=A0AAE9IRF6_CAEBR|nr:hypothetical protein L3Y34_002233 [Caenorhabditis briggsae]